MSKAATAYRPHTVISATALAGVPEFVESTYGGTILQTACDAIMIDLRLVGDPDSFFPHMVMTNFADEVERRTGDAEFGLTLAPHLSVRNYGCWGQYILTGDTLGLAIRRGIGALRYHALGDRFMLGLHDGIARISYPSAARGKQGYRHVAACAAGVIVNLCREYLPPRWRPVRVELDIPKPQRAWRYEDVFGCPVWFGAPAPAVCIAAADLDARRTAKPGLPHLTLDDLARFRREMQNADLAGIVAEQIRLQLLGSSVSLEGAARALDTSVRSLQRELNEAGTTFRDLTRLVRIRRAANLLAETDLPITEIAISLGYSASAHFARAFRDSWGTSPGEFRRSAQGRS